MVVDGSFTASFDDSANRFINVTVNYLNLLSDYVGTVTGSYLNVSDALIFGFGSAGGLATGTNDFRLSFVDPVDPTNASFIYTSMNSGSLLNGGTTSVMFTPASSDPPPPPGGGGNTVPEPETTWLAAVAIAGALAVRRRKV